MTRAVPDLQIRRTAGLSQLHLRAAEATGLHSC